MWNRFILGLVGIGAVGCGALFYSGPGTMAEEVPVHREVGLGFAGLGVLFLVVVLFPKSGAGRRAKYLLFAVSAGVMAGLAGFGVVGDVRAGLKLAEDGRAATALVTARRIRMTQSSRFGTHTSVASAIEYDGHRGVIDGERSVGDRVEVLYLPSEPSLVRAARKGDGFLDIAAADGAGFWIRAGLALLMGLLALLCLPRVLLGAPADDEDPFDT